MRYLDLFESASAKLYHYTSIQNAINILKTGQFELSIATASSDQFQPEGHFYFLSTARTPTGAYHKSVAGFGGEGVMIDLNGSWFNNNYKVKPVDYWNDPNNKAHSEAEDRIFSRKDTMPINAITELHVLLRSDMFNEDGSVDFDHENSYKTIKACDTLQKLGAAHGVPVYFYKAGNMWVLQAEKGRVNITRKKSNLDLAAFVELLQNGNISPEAQDIADKLEHAYDRDQVARWFDNSLHNAKKTDERPLVVKVYNFMIANKLKTVKELVSFLAKRIYGEVKE